MQLASVGSALHLTNSDLELYTKRLYPQPGTAQGRYGCSSESGFLAQGESLLECCEKDRKALEERQVSYKTIADKLEQLSIAALKSGSDGKFTLKAESFALWQICPICHGYDSDCSPFKPQK